MRHKVRLSALLCLLAFPARAMAAPEAVPAFPGAEGFGAYTPGGRGGKVLLVTHLEDYGPGQDPIPGSLRAACETQGPRIVIFRVSGNIHLKGTLAIREPYLTLAGQSAPGQGICLRDFGSLRHCCLHFLLTAAVVIAATAASFFVCFFF